MFLTNLQLPEEILSANNTTSVERTSAQASLNFIKLFTQWLSLRSQRQTHQLDPRRLWGSTQTSSVGL